MELCFMKSSALDTLKNGLPQLFDKYLTERDNSWLVEVCGENPFVKFRDVPDFELASLNDGLGAGEIEFRNCKILYRHLEFLTPLQAADERFWAGLCHGVFYNYMRRRYKYDDEKEDHQNTAKEIKTRFFFGQFSRTGILRNSLAKCWWTGRAFYDTTQSTPFEKLDIVGANDISSKISYILRYPFASNPKILNGIVKFFKHFKDRNVKLGALKETLQPAMAELNKVGGALVLDCLTDEEIAAIIIEYVEKILSGKKSARVEIPVTKTVTPLKVDDTHTVKRGSKVKLVSLDNGTERTYNLNDNFKNQKVYPKIFAALVGKQINSVVTLPNVKSNTDGKFKITDIQ